MKTRIPALIVVEGVSDIDHLSQFIDAEFVQTNGSAVLPSTLSFIGAAIEKNIEVIVLTDPDFPGEKIRHTIGQQFPNVTHAFISKEFAIAKGKVGVAQANQASILKALSFAIRKEKQITNELTMYMMAELGLNGTPHGKILREKVCHHFHLGNCNNKTMVRRLNFLGIRYDDIKSLLEIS
jgi:ribonuclease M5